jgi:hypothetical protein
MDVLSRIREIRTFGEMHGYRSPMWKKGMAFTTSEAKAAYKQCNVDFQQKIHLYTRTGPTNVVVRRAAEAAGKEGKTRERQAYAARFWYAKMHVMMQIRLQREGEEVSGRDGHHWHNSNLERIFFLRSHADIISLSPPPAA